MLVADIMNELKKITDSVVLEYIGFCAYQRAKTLKQTNAENVRWFVGQKVQMKQKYRNKKPYDFIGEVSKVNRVKLKVDFGNSLFYTIPKTMVDVVK